MNQSQAKRRRPMLQNDQRSRNQSNHRPITPTLITILTAALLLPTACAHHARVELAAATALDRLAAEVETALNEYHDELNAADRDKRAAVIDAFVNRIRTDHANPQQTTAHVQQFNDALDRILADTDVERTRMTATRDNIATVRDIAADLRRFAVQSMSLNDDLQRYLNDLLQPIEQPTPPNPHEPN